MAKYKFTARLNTNDLTRLQNELRHYREKTLKDKVKQFVLELAELGVYTASETVSSPGKNGTERYAKYISFYKRITVDNKDVVIVQMIGEGKMKGNLKPLSMVEWGSAKFAEEPSQMFGGEGGKGTWITSGKHVDDEKWIYWNKDKGGWRTNYSVKPTRPMFTAADKMITDVERIAKKVFG